MLQPLRSVGDKLSPCSVLLALTDLQENKARDRQPEKYECNNGFRIHGLRLHSTLSADDHHDADSSAAEQKQDSATERRELPPVGIHAQFHELVVLDAKRVGLIVGHILGHGQFLSRDREVPVRCDAFFHPDVSEGYAVEGDLTVAVHHEVSDVALRIAEVAPVAVDNELQGFKVVLALNLDPEARTHQGIAGGCIDLKDLDPGRAVLNTHDLRVGNAVVVGQRDRDRILSDIAVRCNLDQSVFAGRQIPELYMTVLVYEEGILSVTCASAPIVATIVRMT